MIITFILSQQNNIRRIKGLIRALSERYGRECRKPDGTAYYAFPDVNALASAAEEELRELKLGYRSRYICGSARIDRSRRHFSCRAAGDGIWQGTGRAYETSRDRKERSRTASVFLHCIRWMLSLSTRIYRRCWMNITETDSRSNSIEDVRE